MPAHNAPPHTSAYHCPKTLWASKCLFCVCESSHPRERAGQRHNKWRDCWRMCQRWKEVYLETVIAMCLLSDVQNLNVSGLNFRPCRLIQPCRSSGFVVLLQKKLGPFDKCSLNLTELDRGQIPHPLSLCLWANKTAWFMTGKLFNFITRIICSDRLLGRQVCACNLWNKEGKKKKNNTVHLFIYFQIATSTGW